MSIRAIGVALSLLVMAHSLWSWLSSLSDGHVLFGIVFHLVFFLIAFAPFAGMERLFRNDTALVKKWLPLSLYGIFYSFIIFCNFTNKPQEFGYLGEVILLPLGSLIIVPLSITTFYVWQKLAAKQK